MGLIGQRTKAEIAKVCDSLISANLADIDEAYDLTDDFVDIAIKVRLKPGPEGGVSIEANLSFVKGAKIKDQGYGFADEQQPELFESTV